MKLIDGLPDWQWRVHSRKELEQTGEGLVEQSDFVWQIGNYAICGFVYENYTSPPWMWFLLAEKTDISALLDLRRLSRIIPSGTHTGVEVGFDAGLRFARLYNFVETGEKITNSGIEYIIMRKR